MRAAESHRNICSACAIRSSRRNKKLAAPASAWRFASLLHGQIVAASSSTPSRARARASSSSSNTSTSRCRCTQKRPLDGKQEHLAMTHAAISDLPVLLVDDEPDLLCSVSVLLRTSGLTHVVALDDSRAVLPMLAEQDVGVIVLDLTMPHLCGQELLERVCADHPDVPVILLTATSDLDTAVQCMQAGALDYLVKPVEENRLLSSVKRALDIRAMRTELLALKQCLLSDSGHQREAFAEIVTRDKAMSAVFRYV